MATYANEDIEDFFENAALSLHWVGADGTILRANQFELDFLGYSREEYEGHHIAEFHVDAEVIQDILRRLSAGETLSDYAARVRAKDGTIKHVLINSNVRWVNGEFAHTRCFTRDVTDRHLAEQALAVAYEELERKVDERTEELRRVNESLEELVQLKNRFVAMISHELRTPLTSISGFSVTMERYWDSLPDGEKRKFVRMITEQSDRLAHLVDDLLTLSRVNSGALEVRPRVIEVAGAVAQTAAELGLADVSVSCPPETAVRADPQHFHQMLVNYLMNATKYGAPPISVVAEENGDSVEIRVRDEGEGVPEALMPKLFEEFAAGPVDGDGRTEGTGLGLSIVRHLARAHGGDAWYEPHTQRGAVFALRLPRA